MEALNLHRAEALRPKRKAKKGIEPGWLEKYPQITRAQAVQVFCRECMGYAKHRGGGDESQTWSIAGKMARECTDTECPLYRFRPGAKKGPRLVENTP